MTRITGAVRRKVVQHDFYDGAEQVSGVVLLNSLTNSSWEYEEYLRLLRLRRFSTKGLEPSLQRCYFLCADGVFSKLQAYVEEQQKHRPQLRQLAHLPLCDAVIGDMDSSTKFLSSTNLIEGTELPPSAPAEGYATVDDIPVSVLDQIYERWTLTLQEFSRLTKSVEGEMILQEKSEKLYAEERMAKLSLLPLCLHVRCQMTTDFKKAVLLLNRLRERHKDAAVVTPPPVLQMRSGIQLLETGGSVVVGSEGEGSDNDPQRERDLCSEASKEEIIILPTYVVLGALGGRFDHEMGAITVALSCSKDVHVVITNEHNTIFACEPNGWTQIVRHLRCEGVMCGLINYGPLKECETSGLTWNVVVGRGKKSETQDFALGFDTMISACNSFRCEVVTIDLRRQLPRTHCGEESSTGELPENRYGSTVDDDNRNPPTIFSIERCAADESEVYHKC